jgi:hypothetical protein
MATKLRFELFHGVKAQDQDTMKIAEQFSEAFQATKSLRQQLREIYAHIGKHENLSHDQAIKLRDMSKEISRAHKLAESIRSASHTQVEFSDLTQTLLEMNGKILKEMVYFNEYDSQVSNQTRLIT